MAVMSCDTLAQLAHDMDYASPAQTHRMAHSQSVQSFKDRQVDMTMAPSGASSAMKFEKGKGANKAEGEPPRPVPKMAAHFSRKEPEKAQSTFKPSAKEMLWHKQPARAADMHPVEGFHFQALPCRATPHQPEGAAKRWPAPGYATGGALEPTDDRQHAIWFGYRESRDKRMAGLQSKDRDEPMSITLDMVKEVLTSRYGSLIVAFKQLDFFQDRQLSPVEWREGLTKAFQMYNGPDFEKCRRMVEVKDIFNKRIMQIFHEIDEDHNELISFEEFSKPHIAVAETPMDFTRRRASETLGARSPHGSTTTRLGSTLEPKRQLAATLDSRTLSFGPRTPHAQDRRSSFGGSTEDGSPQRAEMQGTAKPKPQKEGSEMLKDFAALLISRFPNVEAAFRTMDVNNSETLTMNEFESGAKTQLHYYGDARAIFKELDRDGNGSLSLQEFVGLRGLEQVPVREEATRREIVAAMRMRSPIKGPGIHARGICISGSSYNPLTERTGSGAGFHSFGREPTGRLDDLIHPNEFAGVDRDSFHTTTGPGYCTKGPEGFHLGDDGHPLQGSKWKMGGTMGRVERFGPPIPSHYGRLDVELGSGRFQRYAGHFPKDMHRAAGHGTGAASMMSHSERRGPTMGSADAMGLLAPKPIGKWSDSRATLHLKTKSAPCLLKQVVD